MARSYEIQRRQDSGSWEQLAITEDFDFFDSPPFDDGSSYEYRVRQVSPYTSDWSNTVEISYDNTLAGIPKSREIDFRFYVGRNDGITWEELSDYITDITVELGDVSRVGTGNQGGDNIVKMLTFSLINDNDGFHPLQRTSDWNQFDGSYSPLLWINREVRFEMAIRESNESFTQMFGTTQSIRELLGTGDGTSQTYTVYYQSIKEGTETVFVDDVQTTNYTVDYDAGEITTSLAGELRITYVYYHPVFAGLLGDSIRQVDNGVKMSLKARDYSKLMQNAYIMDSDVYGSEDGVPIATVLQSILDDNMDNAPTIRIMGDEPQGVIYEFDPSYMTAFDATQKLVSQIGWFLGYMWHWDTYSWEYTLMEPPRTKDADSYDYYLTDDTDIYKANLDINDRDLRNSVVVEFWNVDTEERDRVVLEDQASQEEFDKKQMLIGEDHASQVNTVEEATALAEAALHDLKDLSSTNKLILPIFPSVNLYDGILLQNSKQSNQIEFYAVESYKLSIKVGGNKAKFNTDLICSGTVKGSHARWLEMETRPGAHNRLSPSELYDNKAPKIPGNLSYEFAGLNAVFNWDKPSEKDYWRSRVEVWVGDVKKRTEYTSDNQYVYTYDKNVADNGEPPEPIINLKLYHIDTAQQVSLSTEIQAVNPAPPTPTGLSVTSTRSQLEIAVDKPVIRDFDSAQYEVSLNSNFSDAITMIDNNFSRFIPVAGEGNNYVRVRFKDAFNQYGSWAETSTEAVMLSAEDMQGSVFQITPSSTPEEEGLESLWDMDTTTGVTFTSAPTIEFHYPMVWLFDMVRFYVDTAAGYTVEALDTESQNWQTVITSGTANADGWTIQRFDASTMVATNKLRITFDASLSIYELKFWVVQLADEILAQVLTLTGDLSIQSETGNLIMSPSGFQAFDSDDNKTVDIGNADGDAWFKGTVEATEGFILPVRSSP